MVKWKVNKERINTDIPDENGNVRDGSVTYATKRLNVNIGKKVVSTSYSYEEYVKDLGIESKREDLEIIRESVTKQQTITMGAIPNYHGLNLVRGYMQSTSGNPIFVGGDVDGNYGVVINGYDKSDYQMPHLRYELNQMYIVKNSSSTYGSKDAILYDEDQEWMNKVLFGEPDSEGGYSGGLYKETKSTSQTIKWTSYMCYPMVTSRVNLMNLHCNGNDLTPDTSNRTIINCDRSYNLLSFYLSDKTIHRYAYWHFHTGLSSRNRVYRFKKENGGYTFDLEHSTQTLSTKIGGIYCDNHLMFIEFETPITPIYDYEKDCRLPNNASEAEKTKHIRYKQMLRIYTDVEWPNGVLLVRTKRRDGQGNVIKNKQGQIEWKLGLHARTSLNYVIKTWNHGAKNIPHSTDPLNNTSVTFFKNTILDNVTEYDTEELDKLVYDPDSLNKGLFVDNALYAEEMDGDIIGSDKPSYQLTTTDTKFEQTYRTYDEISSQLWAREKSQQEMCVDSTTCGLFKEYVQQLLPSTAIIKAPRCEKNENEIIDRDEPKGEIMKERTNVSDVQKELYKEKFDEFNLATYKVYFDKDDGTPITTVSCTLTDESDYQKFLDGTLGGRMVDNYPTVDGGVPEFWYMSANKRVVESGIEIPDTYKFGENFNSVDILKYSGIHFYPRVKPFMPVTYSVYFHDESDALLKTVSKTISDKTEYEQIVADGQLPVILSEIPVVDGLEYWVKENDKDKDSHADSEKYGTATTQSIDLYQDNGIHFYPVRMVEIPMPIYINSATGMEVKGLCGAYTDSEWNGSFNNLQLGYGVVTDNNPYLTYLGDSVNDGLPLINWNPQRFYKWEHFIKNENVTDPRVAAINWCGGSEEYNVLKDETTSDSYYAYKPFDDSELSGEGEERYKKANRYCCFEFVGPGAIRTGRPFWYSDTSSQSSTVGDNKTIPNDSLHGPDNGRFIGYVKFDSRGFTKYAGSFYWHWHWFQAGSESSITSSFSSIELPKQLNPDSKYNNEVYRYIIKNNEFEYEKETKDIQTDVWYGLIISPEIPNPKDVGKVTIDNPNIYLCEIYDEGVMKSEHEPYFNNSSTVRKCYKRNKMYIFSITVKDDTVKWEIDEEDFGNYFSIKSNEATGEIIEIALTNKTGLLASEYGATCVYNPTEKLCIDIDAKYKNKKIFDSLEPICIPEFSGCTFVKAED